MHIVCPHCHNPIELVRLSPREEINCPSCGSSFCLETQTTTGATIGSGQRLGRFTLLDAVGQGGFGTVYKVRDPELDRIVALKVPRTGNLAGPQELDRFLREARSAAQLKHPSIVAVHEVGQLDGVPYLISDFVEGVTLSDLLSARRPPQREAAELLATVAEAVQYAHEQGVIHRDLKPSNIMLNGENRPFVMDFGLAKREAGEITMTIDGQVLGTPAYMSPEQARGEAHRVDGRSDVYSLGVILYEILTGELPFRGTKRMLLHQVLHDEPRSPRKVNDTIARDLETVCLSAMAKDPARRYVTARELAEDLRRWLKGEPIKARPVGRLERAWRWCRRNPAVASLGTLVALLLMIGVVAVAFAVAQRFERAAAEAAQQDAETQKQIADSSRAEADRQRALTEREHERAEWMGYLHQVGLAHREWQQGRVSRARHILDATRAELRGWEFDYVYGLAHNPEQTLLGHRELITGVAFSPDGERVATASHDETVKLWDARAGQETLTLRGHTAWVEDVAFSPDGKHVASASHDGTVRLWDVRTGREALTIKGRGGARGQPRAFSSVTYSPDGTHIAAASLDGAVQVWDARTGQEVHTLQGHTSWVYSVAYSPDGTRIVSGGGGSGGGGLGGGGLGGGGLKQPGEVKVWDAGTGKEVLTLKGHSDIVKGVCFSPDGKRVVAGSKDQTVKVWDARTGQQIFTLHGHDSEVHGVACSPDGTRIVSVGGEPQSGEVKVWDARTGQEILSLRGHTAPVCCVAFSPDGTRIVSAGVDRAVKLWDARGEQDPLTLEGPGGGAKAVAFTPDGGRIVSCGPDGGVKVWDARSAQEVLSSKPAGRQPGRVAVSPDGSLVACGSGMDGTVQVWDARTGREVLTFRGHRGGVGSLAFSPDGGHIASAGGTPDACEVKVWDARTGMETLSLKTESDTGVAFSPDGRRIALGGQDGVVRLWDARTGQEVLCLRGHENSVLFMAFSRDGAMVASGSMDQTVKVWDAHTGQETLSFRTGPHLVTGVAFSPDGKRLASVGGADRCVRVWDVRTGQETLTLRGHTGDVLSVAFSPDGRIILSGSRDGTVKVWQAQRGQEALRLQGHNGWVYCVAFSPDGRLLASGGEDGMARVWDLRMGQETLTLKGHGGWVWRVAFSPDGKRIVTGGMDGTVKVWDVRTGKEALSLQGNMFGMRGVAFSPDGTRVLASSHTGDAIVWDAVSGERLPGPLPEGAPDVRDPEPRSPDGSLLAVPEATLIRVYACAGEAGSAAAAARAARLWRLSAPAPAWHEDQSRRAREQEDWFAVAFHLDRRLRLRPWEASLHLQRSFALRQLDRNAKALAHQLHALFLDPHVQGD